MTRLRKRRGILAIGAGFFMLTGIARAQVGHYPVKPINLIVPYSPGGGTDIMARLIAQELTKMLGVSVIVQNRPGASAIIGTDMVARAPADGYTIGLISSGHAINPALYKTLPFDSANDFAAITEVAEGPNIMAVNSTLPVHSVQDLIKLGKTRTLSFASAGLGQPTQLAGEVFGQQAGIKVENIPYNGSGEAEIGVASGVVDFIVDSVPAALPFITSGKTRALAVTGNARFPSLPGVPTFGEAGMPKYDMTTWWGLVAPRGVPADRIALLSRDVSQILAHPDIQNQFLKFGAQVRTSSPEAFQSYIGQEIQRYGKLIPELGIQPM